MSNEKSNHNYDITEALSRLSPIREISDGLARECRTPRGVPGKPLFAPGES